MSSNARVDALAERLFKIGALKLGDFVLSSGKRSRYYLDLRLVPSHPEVYRMVLDAYMDMVRGIGESSFDAIAGVATAGVTISSPMAVALKKPMVYIRREGKGHGLGRSLEGEVRLGSRVLLVDDLVTTGGSLEESAQKLKEEGCVVTGALVLVDRLEGGSHRLASVGVKVTSFTTIEEIILSLKRLGLVSGEEAEAILGRNVESLSTG
jgi:orotate phosphoribosyltransferase